MLFALTTPKPGVPCSSLSEPTYSLRNKNTEIRPIINPMMATDYSSERKSHMSFTLNQELEMITHSEERVLKAKKSQKLGLLNQTTKLQMQTTSS